MCGHLDIMHVTGDVFVCSLFGGWVGVGDGGGGGGKILYIATM